jgi:Protein of unknown function (DUF2877)
VVRALVIAAAARAALPVLNGPVRDGAVLGAFTLAVIIGVPTPDGPRVLSLLAPTAAGVPNGVRLAAADASVLTRHVPGGSVSVGGGRILLGGVEVRAVRSWPSRVPRAAAEHGRVEMISDTIVAMVAPHASGVPGGFVAALRSALASLPTAPVTSTAPTVRRAADDRLGAAVRQLVGRGIGLTPGGDDVIAGALCGLHATGATGRARVLATAALDDVTDRTTLLSADLLRLAADGDACLEILGVLRAARQPRDVLRPNQSALVVAIDRLLRVGHTSGADLATGLAIGLRAGVQAGTRERAEVG